MSTRREFLGTLGAAPLAGWDRRSGIDEARPASGLPPKRILPRALAAGMRVALVAPASHLFEPERYRMAEELVRSLGLVPRTAAHARDQHGYLAGTDADRAADLVGAFADDDVDAVWCLRGGYGALRILDRIDFELIRAHPKPFLGYSDITALHLAIGARTGLVTFHAPMPGSALTPYSHAELMRVAGTAKAAGRIGAPPPIETGPGKVERANRIVAIRGGKAKGRLIGGNLTLVTRLMGTPFEPDLDGRILFLEEVGEPAYRIDGMLSQLRLSGKLARCAGIVFGKISEESGPADQPVKLAVETVLRELCADLRVPVLWGLLCGHVADQTTVPCGIEAELDADAGTLILTEPAVR